MRVGLHCWNPPLDPTINAFLEADFSSAQAWMDGFSASHGVKVTPTALVIKAFGQMVSEIDDLNVAVAGRRVYRRQTIDATMMVNIEAKKNDLGVVTLRDVDKASIVDVAREVSERRDRVKEGRAKEIEWVNRAFGLVPDFLLGASLKGAARVHHHVQYGLGIDLERLGLPGASFGSFFVSNIGALGLDAGFAPFHPILGIPLGVVVGKVADRPWVVGGRIEPRPVIRLGINCDHRVVSPRHMALGAKRVLEILEEPDRHL